MEHRLQQFEAPVTGRDGETYTAYLHARSRPSNTWQGWLEFERLSDGQTFATPVETTQPTRDAVVFWAKGLASAHFEGALDRALRTNLRYDVERTNPLIEFGVDSEDHRGRLSNIERDILGFFTRERTPRVLTRQLFDTLPYAGADIVRALEDLEKQGRWLVRRTEQGNDWLFLTEWGLRAAGLASIRHSHEAVEMEAPKNTR
jgi:hypothetical protein